MNSEDIKNLFPPETKIIAFSGSIDKYEAHVRCKCESREEFSETWLKQYERLSNVILRLRQTNPKVGKTVVFKASYRCQHNTYPRGKKPHEKHTGCPALMRVTIKSSVENRRVRSIDKLRWEYPTIIRITYDHNHSTDVADTLKYGNISRKERREVTVFENHHTPTGSLQKHDQDSVAVIEDGYFEVATESSLCSDTETIHSPYNSILRDEFRNGESIVIDNAMVVPLVVVQQETVEQNEKLCWDSLQHRWSLLFQKWKSKNSESQYEALLNATVFLENCKTEISTISALRRIRKNSSCGTRRKVQCGDQNSMQSEGPTELSFRDHTYNKVADTRSADTVRGESPATHQIHEQDSMEVIEDGCCEVATESSLCSGIEPIHSSHHSISENECANDETIVIDENKIVPLFVVEEMVVERNGYCEVAKSSLCSGEETIQSAHHSNLENEFENEETKVIDDIKVDPLDVAEEDGSCTNRGTWLGFLATTNFTEM